MFICYARNVNRKNFTATFELGALCFAIWLVFGCSACRLFCFLSSAYFRFMLLRKRVVPPILAHAPSCSLLDPRCKSPMLGP